MPLFTFSVFYTTSAMPTFRRFCLALAIGVTSCGGLYAQADDLIFERISLEHGLSQNTVYCMIQDHKGFLWIGTQDGLNKYDGYDFKAYKHDPENPNSLNSSVITSIYEDHSKVLWVGTNNGGLNKFDRETETFIHYRHDPNDPKSLSGSFVSSIYEDRSGGLWIGTRDGGLNKLVLSDNHPTFIHYRNESDDPNSLSHNYVNAIAEDQAGSLWIATNGEGLNKLVQEKTANTPARFIQYKNDLHDPRSLSDNIVTSLCQDRAGTLWIGTTKGLDKLVANQDGGTPVFIHYMNDRNNPKSLSHNSLSSIYVDHSGTLWIGTTKGLNKFVPGENAETDAAFSHYENDPTNAGTLSDNNVRTIYEDRSGILWIGTWNGGLNKLDRKRQSFTHYEHNPNALQSLSHNNVRTIYEDRSGVLWIGTRGGGLNRLDRKKKSFKHYKFDANNTKSLSHDYVWSILEDRVGTLWIGTYGGGLNKFDRKKETFTRYMYDPNNPNGLSHYNVTPIYEDRAGVLWVGTVSGGLNAFDREKGTFKHYKNDHDDPNSLSHNDVWSIFEDREDTLWIGTSGGGLNKFDRVTERFTHYKNDPKDSKSLSNNYVFSIHEDLHNGGMLWLGTWGGGLNRFDRKTGKFVRFREKDGLPNEVVYGILEDDQGNLWLSTNKGISRFNPKNKSFKSYNALDGLQSNEFNAGAYHKNSSGEMFFGGIRGFNAFHPDSVKDNPYIPPIVITAFRKFDETIASDISESVEFELAYKDKYLTFEFVALDYTHPEKNQYAVMLEGFNSDWIYSGTRRFASYTNLDPGNYVFKVKGSNNDGVWNEQGASIRMIIRPPFWESWWFRLLVATAFVGLLASIYQYRVSHLLAVERLRVRIASDLHDDIGATLTKISLHSDLIQDGACSPEIIASLRKIGAMSRELVTTMSDVVWSIDARNDTIGDLLDRMRDFAVSVLSVKPVDVNFEVSGLDEHKRLPVPLRQNLYLIFKEAINNIAKHAMASKVEIHVKNLDGEFNLTIRDDGKGWQENEYEKLTGHGVRNMKMRAERIGGRLEISRNGGCTVQLTTSMLH